MAIYCPIMKENVLYLDCKDCDDTDLCMRLKICGLSEDINKEKTNDVDEKGEDCNEKDF